MLVSPDVSYWNELDQVIEAAQTKVYKLPLWDNASQFGILRTYVC